MRKTLIVIGIALLAAGATAPRLESQTMPGRGESRVTLARGWLGIMFRPAEADEPMVVAEVRRGSPAARAGVQVGDTVTVWNGRRDVANAIREAELDPGDTVQLRLRRGSGEQTLSIVAATRPGAVIAARRGSDGEEVLIVRPGAIEREMRVMSDSLRIRADSLHERIQILMRDSIGPRIRELERTRMPEIRERLRDMEGAVARFDGETFVLDLGRRSVAGAEFAEVNEGLAAYFGTDDGVLVLKVAPETPAARAGLEAGDVVVEVDDQAISAIPELRRAVARAQTRDARSVKLEVLRKGQRRELQLRWN